MAISPSCSEVIFRAKEHFLHPKSGVEAFFLARFRIDHPFHGEKRQMVITC